MMQIQSILQREEQKCELMGIAGVVIQFLIAILAVLSLFIKRYYENPKRKEKIFLLDMLKQCLSMGTIHIINVFVSIMMENQKEKRSDQCASYLVSFILDVTFGIGLTFLSLKILEKFLDKDNESKCKQGNFVGSYGNICWEAYIIQTLTWIGITIFVKIILFVIFYENFSIFYALAQIILTPFSISQVLKLLMVIIVIPLFCNILTFFFFDQLLKRKATKNKKLDMRFFDIAENLPENFNLEGLKNSLIQ